MIHNQTRNGSGKKEKQQKQQDNNKETRAVLGVSLNQICDFSSLSCLFNAPGTLHCA